MSKLSSHFKNGRQVLPHIPDFQQHSERVVSVLGMNPGPFALTGTNTYLIGTGPKRILLDTGEGKDEYIPNLEKAMESCGCTGLQEIVISHWHFDHLGGVPSVQKRFGPLTVRKYMPSEQEALTVGEGAIDPYGIWPKEEFVPIQDGEVITTEGATLKALFTPGHANDHVAFMLEEEHAMFTGDNVLGVGTAVFKDLNAYINSLEKMKQAKPGCLYPAHGPLRWQGEDSLQEYIDHRMVRVEQVRNLMAAEPEKLWTSESVTRAIYTHVPERLIPPATGNTILVLRKLEADNVVQRDGKHGWKYIPQTGTGKL